MLKIIENYQASFAERKAVFNKIFNEEELSELYKIDFANDNIEFYDKHSDKLKGDELDNLKELIEKRNALTAKLSKQLFKSKQLKGEIASVNEQIKEQQDRLYNQVLTWYESSSANFKDIGVTYSIHFKSGIASMKSDLKDNQERIEEIENAVNETKERIQTIKDKYDEIAKHKEENRKKLEEQIRELAGEEFKDTHIQIYEETVEQNLDSIQHCESLAYVKKIVNKVEREAQNLADIKEAKLRGITLEQLLQEKQQEQLVEDVPVEEETIEDEEVSQGMKYKTKKRTIMVLFIIKWSNCVSRLLNIAHYLHVKIEIKFNSMKL